MSYEEKYSKSWQVGKFIIILAVALIVLPPLIIFAFMNPFVLRRETFEVDVIGLALPVMKFFLVLGMILLPVGILVPLVYSLSFFISRSVQNPITQSHINKRGVLGIGVIEEVENLGVGNVMINGKGTFKWRNKINFRIPLPNQGFRQGDTKVYVPEDISGYRAFSEGNIHPIRYLPNGSSKVAMVAQCTQADKIQLESIFLQAGLITQTQLYVMKNGMDATAVVSQLIPSGRLILDQPEIHADLFVYYPNGETGNASVDFVCLQRHISLVQVGSKVPVRFLPNQPGDVVLQLPLLVE